jgi:TonB family protein
LALSLATAMMMLGQGAPAHAQEVALDPPPAPKTDSLPARMPMVQTPRNPRSAWTLRETSVDIPQWAKDEGHNGSATYRATVGPDGKLVRLELIKSSKSAAIDEAVKARAEAKYYSPATDADGNKIEGTVEVRMGYARHEADSPGGGFRDYSCGALVREYDWFKQAHGDGPPLFWPENAYTSLTSIVQMVEGLTPDRAERLRQREQREVMWGKLIKRCRNNPEKLMIEEVEQPDEYLRLVESF